MKIELEEDTIAVIYNNSNSDGKKAIREELGGRFSEILPTTTRIKTFEDAMSELGEGHEAVKAYKDLNWYLGETEKDILAYLKLRIIVTALNEGWEPQFTEDEKRWFPWFTLYTQEEIDKMSDEEKEKIGLLLWGGSANHGSHCGLAYARTYDAWASTSSHVGSRLTLKSEELALYAGRQFIKIYANFCFKPDVDKTE